MPIQVGSPAPRFRGQAYVRAKDEFREVTLEECRGRWLCLYFYPLDFTALCPTEIVALDRVHPQLQERHCDVLGCSTDSVWVHKAWCEATPELRGLRHPLLSDPTHRISMDYGVFLADKGHALRGIFVIDPLQVLRWAGLYDLSVGRSVPEILRVLDALQTDELCPCNWQKVDATLPA
jgi:lipoyl-dependent peroxiredoxin subunit C